MRVNASLSIAIISAMALATGGCKGGPGPLGPTGPTGPTGPMLPAVTWISPIDGQGSVPLDGVVRAAFNKDMDAATLTAASFQLTASGTTATATVSYNAGNRTAYLAPSSPLASFARYTVTLSTAVKDTGGNALPSAYSWSFWTSGSFSHSAVYLGCFPSTIAVFNAPAFLGGTQVPDRSITGVALTNLVGLWLDSAGDRLYVANGNANSVLVLNSASTTNGAVTPARTISGAATGINQTFGLWLDSVNDQLYVANWLANSVTVYGNASSANGNVAPARTIVGANTGLFQPWNVWLDALSDQLYVFNRNASITVYANASTATGNVAPVRTLSGANTLLNPNYVGLWIDKQSDRLYVANHNAGNILVFNSASTVTGNVAPNRVITTGGSPVGLWLDAAADRLYVGDVGGHVWVFNGASTISGSVTPAGTINTCAPWYLWFDPGN